MTKFKSDYKIEEIINIVNTYYKGDPSIILNAYNYCSKYLDKDKLQDLVNIDYILTTVNADIETICSSMLYNLFINNRVTRGDIEKNFNSDITKLSYGIFKLNKISFSTENDYLVEYYKKVIVGMTEDVRVIIVALADRVYLMRQLPTYEQSEQKRISKETKEIFAPLCHHLGIYKLKSELEDLSLRYLEPNKYKNYTDPILQQNDYYVSNYFEQKVRNLTGESYEVFRALQMLKVQGNIQARMPYLPNIY